MIFICKVKYFILIFVVNFKPIIMKTLTPKQIDNIVYWMNTWERLEGTVIRFREACNKLAGRKPVPEKPPIGIMPEYIWKAQRKNELVAAIIRYAKADREIPKKWIEEFNKITGSKK